MRNFNEWMSFRQSVETSNDENYNFIGTYNTENLKNLKDNSELVEIEKAIQNIPHAYKNQFSDSLNLSAGITHNEQNRQIIWITNNDIELTYLFEKK